MRRFIMPLAVSVIFVVSTASAQNSPGKPLKVGDPIPAFSLPHADMDSIFSNNITSASLMGQRYIIATFPAPWSSGCTKEMCTFRDEFQQFGDLNVKVLPVSGGYIYGTFAWAQHNKLQFDLMADPTREFGKALGVYLPDRGMFQRAVFVVGPTGKVEYIDYQYSVKDDEDLARLKDFLATKK